MLGRRRHDEREIDKMDLPVQHNQPRGFPAMETPFTRIAHNQGSTPGRITRLSRLAPRDAVAPDITPMSTLNLTASLLSFGRSRSKQRPSQSATISYPPCTSHFWLILFLVFPMTSSQNTSTSLPTTVSIPAPVAFDPTFSPNTTTGVPLLNVTNQTNITFPIPELLTPQPTLPPTFQPTQAQSPAPTAIILPVSTISPSTNTSDSIIFPNGTALPTTEPPITFAPTLVPTLSYAPSFPPSISPSTAPSNSAMPSSLPSFVPSALPSFSPTEMPSMFPTFNITESEMVQFTQDFLLFGSKFFNQTEIDHFEDLMETYTLEFQPDSGGRVNTTCEWLEQKSQFPPTLIPPQDRRLRQNHPRNQNIPTSSDQAWRSWRRSLQDDSQSSFLVSVSYRMIYASDTDNVTTFPTDFEIFINSNLARVTSDLNELGILVTETYLVSRFFSQTPQPTISPQPSSSPTEVPTVSGKPSSLPSNWPSSIPTMTESTPPSQSPTSFPSQVPTSSPTAAPESDQTTLIIVIVVVIIASLLMIGLYIFYRRRKKLQARRFQPSSATTSHKRGDPASHQGPMEGSWSAAVGKSSQQKSSMQTNDPRSHYSPDGRGPLGAEGLMSPSESLVSNQSLLSAGNSMGGDSGDEADTTHNLQDEFDQYKDQNLEKMRAEVEGNLSGIDGMMSQALTKALMDDDEVHVDASELLWGGVGHQRGAEIEASALCEVMDWIKRNDTATIDRKRNFMQEMLNKMVSSVRHGVLGPDDASRAIHECAALLELQLASDLPVNTVIISGMRKTATAANLIAGFREFGDIDDAAVASNQRGFGLVRFKNGKSVQRARDKFVLEEVVVQDVAVQVKVVKEVGRR